MSNFNFKNLSIKGVILIESKVFIDKRGSFQETCTERDFTSYIDNARFVQENQSVSKKNVLRGMHYQEKYSQGKLVRVIKGAIYDVGIDIRPGSHTFGKYIGVLLTPDSGKQIYFPPGFAHGFLSLEDDTIVSYKCTNYYDPNDENGIIWNDSTVNINWKNFADPDKFIISEKDKKLKLLQNV